MTIANVMEPDSMKRSKFSTMIFSQNTSVSCACASESAQSRRYDAVFEMAPSTNSIVSITW